MTQAVEVPGLKFARCGHVRIPGVPCEREGAQMSFSILAAQATRVSQGREECAT